MDETESAEAGFSDEAQDNPFRFQGHYYDSGVDAYDMQARWPDHWLQTS